MAAEVSTIVRIMEEAESKHRDLFTRDLLGGGGAAGVAADESAVDLDIQVPSGWERHLDLMSGKTYLHKTNSNHSYHGFHDLNLPPPSFSIPFPETSSLLDLKLSGSDFAGGIKSHGDFQSVCTLEKVKSALERAGRADAASSASASPSSSTTSTSIKRRSATEEDDGGSDYSGGLMAAACPSCLLYVLVSKVNPRCPRCDSHVPLAFIPKKIKFDLNSY